MMIPHARSPKVLVRDFDEIVNRFGTTKLNPGIYTSISPCEGGLGDIWRIMRTKAKNHPTIGMVLSGARE